MNRASETLRDALTALIEEALAKEPSPEFMRRTGFHMHARRTDPAAIADELVREAVASGFPLNKPGIDRLALGGGNTAEVVALLTLHAPFVFKLDQQNPKLAAEGEMMRKVRNSTLPP